MKILVNGTFDIVHRGHIEMLNYAKSLGDHLVVCIDSDRRVRELKGEHRPVNNEQDRKFYLENLRAVDQTWIFDSAAELEDMCSHYQPDVMVKGSDYKHQPIVGSEHCKKIVFFDRIEQYSTTKTIENINNRK
jgi:D-beta-D-heptose 7-phosphate kinase/D-beta-D-heptose 1-phosphate adenosyltransferase